MLLRHNKGKKCPGRGALRSKALELCLYVIILHVNLGPRVNHSDTRVDNPSNIHMELRHLVTSITEHVIDANFRKVFEYQTVGDFQTDGGNQMRIFQFWYNFAPSLLVLDLAITTQIKCFIEDFIQ